MKQLKVIILVFILSAITMNAKSLRIEAVELSQDMKKYTILDTRSYEVYLQGHIKNALSFPINLTYEDKKLNGKITNPVKMQKIIRELGLEINTPIVIYDDGTFFDASRLFWALEVYGFTNIKLLNSGYSNWLTNNYETSTTITKVKKSNYIAKINYKRLATKFTTQIATHNPSQVILDARDYKSYIGKKSTAKRFGHIPKALYMPATQNISYLNKVSKLKTMKKLKNVYSNIDKKKKIIIYCAMGRTAATNYFALRELDYDVSNYDASWNEWGNDFTLPIVNNSKD